MKNFNKAKFSLKVLTNLISNHLFEITRPILFEIHKKLNVIIITQFNKKNNSLLSIWQNTLAYLSLSQYKNE